MAGITPSSPGAMQPSSGSSTPVATPAGRIDPYSTPPMHPTPARRLPWSLLVPISDSLKGANSVEPSKGNCAWRGLCALGRGSWAIVSFVWGIVTWPIRRLARLFGYKPVNTTVGVPIAVTAELPSKAVVLGWRTLSDERLIGVFGRLPPPILNAVRLAMSTEKDLDLRLNYGAAVIERFLKFKSNRQEINDGFGRLLTQIQEATTAQSATSTAEASAASDS